MTQDLYPFKRLIDFIFANSIETNINVYGKVGIGKSRLVFEVASYLKYRYHFSQGVYMLDLNNIHDLSYDLNKIINSAKSHTKNEKKDEMPNMQKVRSNASSKLKKAMKGTS